MNADEMVPAIQELTAQEEIDMEDRHMEWDYKSPDHKPPFKNTDYTEMDCSDNEEVMSITVGAKGINFKNITESNEIAYIWHDRINNKIGIWGESRKFDKVISQIMGHMDYASNLINSR